MKYGFIGLGLIGGSLARNLKKLDPACTICAYTRTQKTSMEAREAGVLDEICTSPSDELFRGCDYIFLCAPVITPFSQMSALSRRAFIRKSSGWGWTISLSAVIR